MIKFATNDDVSRLIDDADKVENSPLPISYFKDEIIEMDSSLSMLGEVLNSLLCEPNKKCIANILHYSRIHNSNQ